MPRASKTKTEARKPGVEVSNDFHFAGSSEAKVQAQVPGIVVEQKALEPDIRPAMERFNPEDMAAAKNKAATASEELKKSFGVGRKPLLVDSSPNSQLANRHVFYVR